MPGEGGEGTSMFGVLPGSSAGAGVGWPGCDGSGVPGEGDGSWGIGGNCCMNILLEEENVHPAVGVAPCHEWNADAE